MAEGNKSPPAKPQAEAHELTKEKSRSAGRQGVVVDTKALMTMSARDRVVAGYKLASELRSRQFTHASASFCSKTARDPHARGAASIARMSTQHERKETMVKQREDEWRHKYHLEADKKTLKEYTQDARSQVDKKAMKRDASVWAKDKTPRGGYSNFCWKNFPECIPPRRIEDRPGPGSYTDPLHFVGWTSH